MKTINLFFLLLFVTNFASASEKEQVPADLATSLIELLASTDELKDIPENTTYRCVVFDENSNEVLDESLDQLPGEKALSLFYRKSPNTSFLVPVNDQPIAGIDIEGEIEFNDLEPFQDNSNTTYQIYFENTYFGGNFQNTVKVIINQETDQLENVASYLCEAEKIF